jgi:hypothetical protein
MQTDFAVSRPICRVGLPAVRASSAKILLNTDHPGDHQSSQLHGVRLGSRASCSGTGRRAQLSPAMCVESAWTD